MNDSTAITYEEKLCSFEDLPMTSSTTSLQIPNWTYLHGLLDKAECDASSGNFISLRLISEDITKLCNQESVAPIETIDASIAIDNPPPPLPTLIDSILLTQSSMSINAPSKAGKSFLAGNLGLSLASGRPWLGKYGCRRSKVLILNFEIHQSMYLRRLSRIAKKMNISTADVQGYLYTDNLRGHNIILEQLLPHLEVKIAELGINVIIIDPFYRMLQSSERAVEENSNTDVAMILSKINGLLLSNVNVIWIAHYAKGFTSVNRSVADRQAGAGVLGRDPDAILSMSPLDPDKAPGCYRIEGTLREFPPFQSIEIKWEYPLHSIIENMSNIECEGKGGRPSELDVLELIDYWKQNKNDAGEIDAKPLCEFFGVSSKTVQRRLKELRDKDDIYQLKFFGGKIVGKDPNQKKSEGGLECLTE